MICKKITPNNENNYTPYYEVKIPTRVGILDRTFFKKISKKRLLRLNAAFALSATESNCTNNNQKYTNNQHWPHSPDNTESLKDNIETNQDNCERNNLVMIASAHTVRHLFVHIPKIYFIKSARRFATGMINFSMDKKPLSSRFLLLNLFKHAVYYPAVHVSLGVLYINHALFNRDAFWCNFVTQKE